MLLLAALLATCLCLAAGRSPAPYDSSVSGYVSLEDWLRQSDLQSCLTDSPADVLFVADGSQSVGLTDFHLVVKSVLVDTISKLRLSRHLVQAGVLVFSDQVSQTIPIGRYDDKLQLLTAVSNLEYVGSYMSLQAAVEGSVSELQRRSAELRRVTTQQVAEQRKTVVVFVTDGWANHGSSLYLRELVGELQAQATGVVALGLEKSNAATLKLLASDPTLVFTPTTYPDYLAAVFNLLNSRCSNSCYRYQQQKQEVHKVIMALGQYISRLVENYASFKRQEHGMLQYIRELNASIVAVETNINRSCGVSDVSVEKIVDLRTKLETVRNSSAFGGLTADVFISKLIEKVNSVQSEVFIAKRKVTIEKSRREGLILEQQQMTEEMEAKLKSQIAIREANEAKLKALEDRIATSEQQLLNIELTMNNTTNMSQQLSERLQLQERTYAERLKVMQSMAETHATLITVRSGGSAQFTEIQQQIKTCQRYLRDKETVLFAIRCGSGASFESLFVRDFPTFAATLEEPLTVYKSSLLRHMHTMGYFTEVSLHFIVGGSVVAKLAMDTSRFQLSDVFSEMRATASYPWVASYINSVYTSTMPQFHLHPSTEFLLIFGDLTRYEETQKCSDLVGVFVVLHRQHRCFPDATTFPQVYISTSPYGGRFLKRIDEFRIVTRQPPTETKQLPTIETSDKKLSEILVYIRSGAGFLQPLLLSPRYSAASILADIDDISQLSQHYKSSLLAKATSLHYDTVQVQLFDASENEVASLEFRGPFDDSHNVHGAFSEVGATHEAWDWFSPRYLHSASPFDIQQLRQATFRFYDGKEFFSIGTRMAGGCEQRRYFLTVVDNGSYCSCFTGSVSPAVYFSGSSQATECKRLKMVRSLRVTASLRRQVG